MAFSMSTVIKLAIFPSITEACRQSEIKYTTILWCCLNKKMHRLSGDKTLSTGPFVWKFYKPNISYSPKDILKPFLKSDTFRPAFYDYTKEAYKNKRYIFPDYGGQYQTMKRLGLC